MSDSGSSAVLSFAKILPSLSSRVVGGWSDGLGRAGEAVNVRAREYRVDDNGIRGVAGVYWIESWRRAAPTSEIAREGAMGAGNCYIERITGGVVNNQGSLRACAKAVRHSARPC